MGLCFAVRVVSHIPKEGTTQSRRYDWRARTSNSDDRPTRVDEQPDTVMFWPAVLGSSTRRSRVAYAELFVAQRAPVKAPER